MRKDLVLLLLFISVTATTPIQAEDIDVRAALDERLAALKDYALPDVCSMVQVGTQKKHIRGITPHTGNTDIDSVDHGYDVDVPVMAQRCDPAFGKLKSEAVKIERVQFDKMDVVKNALPSKIDAQAFVSINCTEAEQRPSFDFTFTTRHMTSTVTTHGIKNAINVNTKGSFKYAGVGFDVGMSDTYEVSNSTSDTVTDEGTETKKVTLPVTIKEMTNFVSQGKIIRSTDRLQWHATVLVDAPVSPNKEGKKYASEVLGEQDRTFEVEGYISNVRSSDVVTDYFSTKVTPAECADRIKKGLPMSYKLNHLVIE